MYKTLPERETTLCYRFSLGDLRDSIFVCFVVLSRLSYKQDKRMDKLNLFIDYHYKSIVSVIRARHVLTLHLSHAN